MKYIRENRTKEKRSLVADIDLGIGRTVCRRSSRIGVVRGRGRIVVVGSGGGGGSGGDGRGCAVEVNGEHTVA